MEDMDYLLALQLQEKFQSEAAGSSTNKENQLFPNYSDEFSNASSSKGKRQMSNNPTEKFTSLNDSSWEVIDPTPDIYALFGAFNGRFFWGKLDAVEVKWSKQMTSCAGLCYYQGKAGLCSVRLSEPLLKLRPRSDLINTLLHEMIHAFLFVTANNRDRDGHGPEFHKHMNRINKEAGTKITVYHTFHDEVSLYQQHWWRCDGPCRERKPYYGYVKRAKNRAPGPNDFWWGSHQAECGGTYVKIKEPENYVNKKDKKLKTSSNISESKSSRANSKDIRNFFPQSSTPQTSKPAKPASSGSPNIVGFNDLNKLSSPASTSSSQSNIVGFNDWNSGKISNTGKNASSSTHNPGKTLGTGNSSSSRSKNSSVPGSSNTPGSRGRAGKVIGAGGSGRSPGSNSNSASGKTGSQGRGGFVGGGLKNRGSSTMVIPPRSQTKTKEKLEEPKTEKADNPLNIDRFQAFSSNGQVLGGHANDRSRSRLLEMFANQEREKQTPKERTSPTADGRRTVDFSSPEKSPTSGSETPTARRRLPKSNHQPLKSFERSPVPTSSNARTRTLMEQLASPSTSAASSSKDHNAKTSTKRHSDCNTMNSAKSKDKHPLKRPLLSDSDIICVDTPERPVKSEKNQSSQRPLFSDADVFSVDTPERDMVSCPVCSAKVKRSTVNDHLDTCAGFLPGPSAVKWDNENQVVAKSVVATSNEECSEPVVYISDDDDTLREGQDDRLNLTDLMGSSEPEVPCPCCNKLVSSNKINEHLDICLNEMTVKGLT